tara:strand:+ start:1576 stop:2025 length:450 start_codon:yes stop_codon:yes gene_type:complete
MRHAQNVEYFTALVPAAQTGTTLSSAIDCTDADSCTIMVQFGAIAASGDLTTFALQSSATSGGTYADETGGAITDAVIGTAALPAADDDDKLFVYEIDCKKLANRFLKVNIIGHGSNAATFGISGFKSRKTESPAETAAGKGCEAVVRI